MTKFYDNSRLSDHKACNRYFYWRHRRHLESIKPNIPAAFGSCWGKAMDTLWPATNRQKELGITDNQIIELTFEAFCKEWQYTYGFPFLDDMTDEQVAQFTFRNEQTAAAMIPEYLDKRKNFIQTVEIVAIEQPFAVPIDPNNPDLFYVGKIDKEIRWEGKIWGLDHKTSSSYRKDGGFAGWWLDSWNPKAQLDGYMHSLRMRYGKQAKGILVDGALVWGTVHDQFTLIPIEKVIEQLETWLWETHHEIAVLEANDRNLEAHRQQLADGTSYNYMPAFPKNDNYCIKFMKPCQFLDLCKSIPDPERQPDRVPEGFTVRKWEPFDELSLDRIGLAREE